MSLKDHVAVVTGAGQGIGRAIAKRLAKDGAKVGILEINEKSAQETAKQINDAGGTAVAYTVDCTNRDQVDQALEQITQDLGGIKILANNIGWSGESFFEDEEESYWDKVIAINLKAPMLVTQAVLKSMKEQGEGHIVSLASDAARVGQLKGVAYSACKGGVVAFTKALAREVAKFQINVNCICPGPTQTPLYEAAINEKIKKAFTQIIPLKRIAQPEEIANAVAFLVSPEASYITGQVLSVSGGLTMAG